MKRLVTHGVIAATVSLLFIALSSSLSAQTGLPADCAKTYKSGAGVKGLRFCVTSEGNVIWLEAPLTSEHIYSGGGPVAEGFAICATGVSSGGVDYSNTYYNTYDGQFHMGATTRISDSPFTIETGTADLGFTLRQKITRDAPEQEVLIQMTLTNTAPISRTNVVLKRIADLDIDGTSSNVWDHTLTSVWARSGPGTPGGVGVVMTGAPVVFPTVQPNFTHVTGFGNPCLSDSVAGPVTGDYLGVVGFSIGTMAPGSSATVGVRYGRH